MLTFNHKIRSKSSNDNNNNNNNKSGHDRVADVVHWSLCHKYGLQCTSKWYEHYGREHPVMENKEVKILWDFNVETEHVIVHRRPDIVVLEKEKKALLIDIAVPGDVIEENEEEKVMKCLVK